MPEEKSKHTLDLNIKEVGTFFPTAEQRQQGGMKKRVERDFAYHTPKGDQLQRYQQIRDKAKELALLIVELTPASREQEAALTQLEYASMMANAAIARHE
jgi:hypothetical protein